MPLGPSRLINLSLLKKNLLDCLSVFYSHDVPDLLNVQIKIAFVDRCGNG